jgi:hypothetical protein
LHRLADGRGIVDRQRGLGDHGQLVRMAHLHRGHVVHVFDQVDAFADLAHRAFDLGVALVADHDELVALAAQLGHLDVHLGDQRAGGVEHLKTAGIRLAAHAWLTPWALKISVAPGGTSARSSMKMAPLALRSLTT